MSSGPLRMMLKPRRAFSSWREETPRSSSAPEMDDDAEFFQHLPGIAEVCLAEGDAATDMRQLLAREFDRLGILIERKNVRARLEQKLGMAPASAGAVDDKGARAWREQLDRFHRENRTVIS